MIYYFSGAFLSGQCILMLTSLAARWCLCCLDKDLYRVCVMVVEALPGIWMESDSPDPFPPSTLLVNSPFQWPAFWTQLGSGVYKWYWLTDSLRLLSACFQVLWYLRLLKDCIVHRFSCIQKYDPFVSEFSSCFTSWNWLIAPLWPF